MRRFLAGLSVLVALLGGLVVFVSPPANAVQSLAYEFVVPCADADGVNSSELGVDLPSGTYAVVAIGACAVSGGIAAPIEVGTPCSAPEVGTIPCVSTDVDNVPAAACWVTGLGLDARPCETSVGLNGCAHAIVVDGQCLIAGLAGTISHPGGNMNAQFSDIQHWDNIGYFLVTVVWTPL